MNPKNQDYIRSKVDGIFDILQPIFNDMQTNINQISTELNYSDSRLETVIKILEIFNEADEDTPLITVINMLEKMITSLNDYNHFSAKK